MTAHRVLTEPHIIRLAGPWEMGRFDPSGATDWQRVKLPTVVPSSHPMSLRRWFHKPTGLSGESIVRVVFKPSPGDFQLFLNDALLGQISADEPTVSIDLPNLQARNCLLLNGNCYVDSFAGATLEIQ